MDLADVAAGGPPDFVGGDGHHMLTGVGRRAEGSSTRGGSYQAEAEGQGEEKGPLRGADVDVGVVELGI